MKKFTKNDSEFVCVNCGAEVPKLHITSRDHCNKCLHSLHVDVNPGDRANECKGVLKPVGVALDRKKGYVIEYKCRKCGKAVFNKAAVDDDFDIIIKTSKLKTFKKQ